MLTTKRKPVGVGEILVEEFMRAMGLTQSALAEAMGVARKHVSELCNDRRAVTAPTALILARVFGNGPDFWLNVQRRSDLWEAMHSPRERERLERVPIALTAIGRCAAAGCPYRQKLGQPVASHLWRPLLGHECDCVQGADSS